MGKQPYARKGDSAGVMGRSNWASVVELSKPELVGTLLTLQTALGVTLKLVTSHLKPHEIGRDAPGADLEAIDSLLRLRRKPGHLVDTMIGKF